MTHDVARITDIEQRDDALLVRFASVGEPLALPWFWVRDHSEDPGSLDPSTMQRVVDTFTIAPDLAPRRAELHERGVRVHWSDGAPPSELSTALLAEVAGANQEPAPRLWREGGSAAPTPAVGHDDVMGSEAGLLAVLDAVAQDGFGLVRGMPQTRESAEALARRVAAPRSTIFGTMWSLSSSITDHADSAYSTSFLEPHTDGTYVHDAPGLQLFACLERSGSGGESILVDGFAVAEQLRRDAPDHFAVLTRVAVPGRYLEPGIHLQTRRPTIQVDGDGRLRQVSFNNYDRAPFVLPPPEMAEWYDAYRDFHHLVTERDHWLLVKLEPGEVLLFDNWRVLHGRMAYTGTRVFEGCYHNHEDFESRLRVLRDNRRRAGSDNGPHPS